MLRKCFFCVLLAKPSRETFDQFWSHSLGLSRVSVIAKGSRHVVAERVFENLGSL